MTRVPCILTNRRNSIPLDDHGHKKRPVKITLMIEYLSEYHLPICVISVRGYGSRQQNDLRLWETDGQYYDIPKPEERGAPCFVQWKAATLRADGTSSPHAPELEQTINESMDDLNIKKDHFHQDTYRC